MSPVVKFLRKKPKFLMMYIKSGEYLTVSDMADRLKKNKEAVKKLLHNAGFKPLDKNALYPIEAFNAIKDAPGKGRPRKAAAPEASKPTRKGKK